METASDAPRTVSVYSIPTRVLAAVVLAICAALTVNLIVAGTPTSIWHFLPWILFVAWGVFVLLWRPCLLVHPDGVTVRNLLRDHTIPFDALRSLRVIHTVTLDTTAGRISSWGAPGAGKLGPRRASKVPAGLPTLPHTQTVIQTQWDIWERDHSVGMNGVGPNRLEPNELGLSGRGMNDAGASSRPRSDSQLASVREPRQPGKVTSRWNVPVVVVGVLLAVLGVISTLS